MHLSLSLCLSLCVSLCLSLSLSLSLCLSLSLSLCLSPSLPALTSRRLSHWQRTPAPPSSLFRVPCLSSLRGLGRRLACVADVLEGDVVHRLLKRHPTPIMAGLVRGGASSSPLAAPAQSVLSSPKLTSESSDSNSNNNNNNNNSDDGAPSAPTNVLAANTPTSTSEPISVSPGSNHYQTLRGLRNRLLKATHTVDPRPRSAPSSGDESERSVSPQQSPRSPRSPRFTNRPQWHLRLRATNSDSSLSQGPNSFDCSDEEVANNATVDNPEQAGRLRSDSTGSEVSIGTAWDNCAPSGHDSPITARPASLHLYETPKSSSPLAHVRTVPPSEDYHHGFITRQVAEQRLTAFGLQDGTFLIREKQARLVYALSVVSDGKIQHHIIERAVRKDGTLGSHYILNGKRLRDCTSLQAVVDRLKGYNKSSGRTILTRPCPPPTTVGGPTTSSAGSPPSHEGGSDK
ncbi:uncharacterized protein MONBRDRAFT_28545 [Monosiga brevicollis MX1]|uniref:SH2 domain-containing protein n=1 Tax=Monosiga brevicollis TaxID=81824 RepID=A9V8H4_MONBE|nr:uncharacterized protein MONBRDRAFT_28545 [Monosiga brevicollis MX1]EDQ86083.1 predicted protein [Monosiga brevicollis MX1]|eukprot:XP_001749008.1 hypothetical protein [Monosiga brevicollis MX1]